MPRACAAISVILIIMRLLIEQDDGSSSDEGDFQPASRGGAAVLTSVDGTPCRCLSRRPGRVMSGAHNAGTLRNIVPCVLCLTGRTHGSMMMADDDDDDDESPLEPALPNSGRTVVNESSNDVAPCPMTLNGAPKP